MKRKFGDRKDATLVRKTDAIHLMMPLIWPNRCDSTVFITKVLDLTKTKAYLDMMNAKNPEHKYTIFHIAVAAGLKMIMLRPKMNYFIAGKKTWHRNDITASFIVRKEFIDDAEEGVAIIHAEKDDTCETIHDKITDAIIQNRSGTADSSEEDFINFLNKLPHWMVRMIGRVIVFLDKRGKLPRSIEETDFYYASAAFSNFGSIQIQNGLHHLTNWGTTSLFFTVGEMREMPFYNKDGSREMRYGMELGITADERIFDGYYHSQSQKLMYAFIENPELLDLPLAQEIPK